MEHSTISFIDKLSWCREKLRQKKITMADFKLQQQQQQ